MTRRMPVFVSLVLLSTLAVLVPTARAQMIREGGMGGNPGVGATFLIEGAEGNLPEMLSLSGMNEVADKGGYECYDTSHVWIPGTSGKPDRLLVHIKLLSSREEASDSQKVAKAMAERLQKFLDTIALPLPDKGQLKAAAEQRVEERAAEEARLRHELRGLKDALFDSTGGLSPEGAADQRRDLQKQATTLGVELVGLKARREAILKHLEKMRAAASQSKPDPQDETTIIIRGLQNRQAAPGKPAKKDSTKQPTELDHLKAACQIAERAVESTSALHKVGKITQESLLEAQRRLAEARIQLERRQHELRNEAVTWDRELLASLNQELTRVEIDLAAAEAKYEAMQKEMTCSEDRAKQSLNLAQEIEAYGDRLKQAREKRIAAEKELDRLKEQAAHWRRPKVTLLDEGAKANLNKAPKKESPTS